MEAEQTPDAPAPKKATGRRVLYWIGGLFALAAVVNTADRLIDPEGYEKREAQRLREQLGTPDKVAADEKAAQLKAAEDKSAGTHCLSPWDGSNRSLKTIVQNGARNPDSFEHIDTRIRPAVASDKTGRLEHPVVMRFRAENGFGGMNVGVAVASVDNETCQATLINLTEG